MKVRCQEPEGEVEREVRSFVMDKDSLLKLYERCAEFPVLFGRELSSLEDFLNHFLVQNLSDDPEPAGLMWIVDDYVGMFYMDEMRVGEATVHYSFFDRRHKGREALVKAMCDDVFKKFKFNRLNVYIPAYAGMGPRKFVERCGFQIEGRKRKASWWKGKLFDVYCYGLLQGEIDGRIA